MANEFIARNGIISKNNVVMTGSLTANKFVLSGGADQSELTNTVNNDFKLTNSGSFRIVNGTNTVALLTVTNGGTSSFSGNMLIGTSTDSTSGFNRVLSIANDYLPSLELRKTGSIGGTRTYNLGVGNTGNFSIYDATVALDRVTITNSGSLCIGSSVTTGQTLNTANAGVTNTNAYFGTGQVRIGGGSDHGGSTVLSVAPGVITFDRPGVGGGAMTIDSNGYMTKPSQPSFYATSNAGSSTYGASEVIVFNTARHNIGSCYNTSTGRFTAPIAGRYMFILNVYNYSGYSNSIVLTINGSQYAPTDVNPLMYAGNIGSLTGGFTIIWELAANDYVEVRVRAGGSANIYRAHSHFSGCLLS